MELSNKVNPGIFVFLTIFLFVFALEGGVVKAQEANSSEKANCSEQLQICIDEYNSLLSDFRNGTNCGGTSFNLLKDMNQALGERLEEVEVEVKNLKNYKIGFFLTFVLFLILLIFCFFGVFRNKKREKRKFGGGNAGKNTEK